MLMALAKGCQKSDMAIQGHRAQWKQSPISLFFCYFWEYHSPSKIFFLAAQLLLSSLKYQGFIGSLKFLSSHSTGKRREFLIHFFMPFFFFFFSLFSPYRLLEACV